MSVLFLERKSIRKKMEQNASGKKWHCSRNNV